MSHQIRPGARGGRDQFSWDQVKEDKQRSNYLGSSIHGLPDKFKKGPETFWYAKETKTISEKKSEKSEIELIKEKERLAMEALLGGSIKKKDIVKEQVKQDLKLERPRENSPDRINDRNRSYSRSSDQRDYERRYHDSNRRETDNYYKYRIDRRENENDNYYEYRSSKYDYDNLDRENYRRHERTRRYDRSRSPKMYK